MWLYLFIANVHYLLSMISMKLASMIWLEANSEQSESNPGRSLGIIKQEGTAVWKTVPPCCAHSPSAQSACAQNSSRIAPMRRILSFSRISFYLVLPVDIGFTTDCFCAYTALDYLQQEIIRDNHCAQQAQKILQHNKNP